jgi:hypothetical protein
MNSMPNTLAQLSEQALLGHFETLIARDRRTTAQLLVAIAEIDERKLWARHACQSMFAFCVERFHMSEQVTAKRIWAARTARRFPVVLEMVQRGELHLSAIYLLARHLTADNYADVLQRARHKSSREIERLVAALAPRDDVASRVRALPRKLFDGGATSAAVATASGAAETAASGAAEAAASSTADTADSSTAAARVDASDFAPASPEPAANPSGPGKSRILGPVPGPSARPITALSPRRYKIEITVDEDTYDKLRSLQDLLGRSQVGRDPAAIISRAIDILLMETLKRKAASIDRPRQGFDASATTDRPQPASPACEGSPTNTQPRSRSIPAALRRVVWRRDCGRCRYTDGRGRRCNATSNVEFHHKNPFAKGGSHDEDNVELRCSAHNQYQADLDFGRDFMDARRTAGGRC